MMSKKHVLIVGIVLIVSVLITIPEWHPKGYLQFPESYFTGIFDGTTDTGEGSPIWSVRFMEHRAKARVLIVSGQAIWSEVSRTTTKHVYDLTATTLARVVENTLYFPGWKILVDGSPVSPEFQDPDFRGLMTFWVTPGTHAIIVQFGDTKVRTLSNGISVIAWAGLFGAGLIWFSKRLTRT